MSADRELAFSDLVRARERRDPQFASLVVQYLDQPDPPENAPELAPDGVDGGGDDAGDAPDAEHASAPPLPKDAWTMQRLHAALAPHNMWGKSPEERHALRREAWDALLSAPYPPPRLELGDLLIEMYDRGDEWSRAQLAAIFRDARMGWGIWKGFKHIYKRVEQDHDAELFGVLAWRLDAMGQTDHLPGEVSSQTIGYMKRRAWRYLRQLGQAVPELYPQFAVQVLRHFPREFWFWGAWVANQIWAHKSLIGARTAWQSEPPAKLEERAFDDAWKLSPDPLLRLLEDAHNDHVCRFAIRGLQADFPSALRDVDPRWLARVGAKPLESVHEFAVELLTDNPALHQSALASLGLHDMVVGWLRSDSAKAVAYAIEYARAHAPDIPVDRLIDIAEHGDAQVVEFVRARLGGKSPRELGLPALIRMLAVDSLVKLARKKLEDGFSPDDLDAQMYVALATGDSDQQKFVDAFYKAAKVKVPARFLVALAESDDIGGWQRRRVLDELGKRKAAEIGIEWLQRAVVDARFAGHAAGWLRAGMLRGDQLDVAWLKGLAMRPASRALALDVLGNPKYVAPRRLGLDWLLSLARHADDQLAGFAHRYLLEHFEPADFAPGDARDVDAGVDALWALLGPDQPEPVRRFAAAYLKVHHPELGPTTDEARQHGVKPRLSRAHYGADRLRPLLFDPRADVRRLAAAIGRHELVAWGDRALVYELAASRHREPRGLAAQALLHIGEPDADPAVTPPPGWLDPDRVFALAEGRHKATREIALTLIRRHYDALGGAHKLGWLMESPDREVRLFAVRLLWDRHRPADGPRAPGSGRFESVEALQGFLRAVLFGLPPGRMERRDASADPGAALPDRPLPASVAKRRLIGVVRDMGVGDADFARVVAPVLEQFVHSQAKGEWHGCVAALAHMRRAHPALAAPPATSEPAGAVPA